ncbi:MAG: DinB family protein [Candidatus Eisenbacteria bacterium]
MNKQYIQTLWEEMRLVYGISMRVYQAIPKDKIDSHPIAGMRTPKEIIAHMTCTLTSVATGTVKGQIEAYEAMEKEYVAKPYDDFMKWVGEGWSVADTAVRGMTDAQATGMVKNPWTTDFPAFACIQIIFDEHLHHRGQLYAYLRCFGVEPPFLWDFENSAKEYQPRQHQPA